MEKEKQEYGQEDKCTREPIVKGGGSTEALHESEKGPVPPFGLVYNFDCSPQRERNPFDSANLGDTIVELTQ